MITKEEVISAQNSWSDGLLEIVNSHLNNNDYISCASEFIDRLYNFENGEVLFKPTLAREIQFRNTKEAALSYFIANNPSYAEDSGFALKKWTSIKWDNCGIQVFENIAVAMGNYYFTNYEGTIMVEFSFVYKKNSTGELKIILHDSHLPYQK